MMPAPTPTDVNLGGEAHGVAEGIKARGIAAPTLSENPAAPTTGQLWPRNGGS